MTTNEGLRILYLPQPSSVIDGFPRGDFWVGVPFVHPHQYCTHIRYTTKRMDDGEAVTFSIDTLQLIGIHDKWFLEFSRYDKMSPPSVIR